MSSNVISALSYLRFCDNFFGSSKSYNRRQLAFFSREWLNCFMREKSLVENSVRPHSARPMLEREHDRDIRGSRRLIECPPASSTRQTDRISVSILYAVFVERDDCTLQYYASGEHDGDMFTNQLDPTFFEVAITRPNLRRTKLRTA